MHEGKQGDKDMIFSVSNHIEQIINGSKRMTRRSSDRYQEDHLYSIQPKRTAKGIPEGKIYITFKKKEWKPDLSDLPPEAHFSRDWRQMEAGYPIQDWEAVLEGGYTSEEFEKLYEQIHPNWRIRWAYMFTFFDKTILAEMGVK